jgi:hypothetical protein
MQESQSNGKKKNNRKKKDKTGSGPGYGHVHGSDATSKIVAIPSNRPNSQQNHPHGHSTQQTQYAARERAKADALFASTSSHWYAGAAFDRSPAANTLPRPTRLLNKTDEQLATSCPTSSIVGHVTPAGSRTRGDSPPLREGNGDEELREKSRELLRMLKSTTCDPTTSTSSDPVKLKSTCDFVKSRQPAESSTTPTSGEDLEEMTRQIRKLLNLS